MALRARNESRKERPTSKVRTESAPPPPVSSAESPAARLVPYKEMPGSGNTGPVNVVGPPR